MKLLVPIESRWHFSNIQIVFVLAPKQSCTRLHLTLYLPTALTHSLWAEMLLHIKLPGDNSNSKPSNVPIISPNNCTKKKTWQLRALEACLQTTVKNELGSIFPEGRAHRSCLSPSATRGDTATCRPEAPLPRGQAGAAGRATFAGCGWES